MQNCHITHHVHDPKTIGTDYDMVLFHAEENFNGLVQRVEHTRRPNQLYGLLIIEPPHIVADLSYLNNKINWTVSYRADADSKWLYGSVRDKLTGQDVRLGSQKWHSFDPSSAVSSYVRNSEMPGILAKKTKMIAWFVSNCHLVKSGRMELAQAINKYIGVDIYGKCGTLNCSRSDAKCWDMLEQDYKFYLSFENSLCVDYITEKAFGVMKRAIIPVIFSGANLTQILPPHSYINVEDFASVEELASYLTYLANNPEEYLKYFWWKEFYTIGQRHFSCHLCQKLNAWNRNETVPAYSSLENWYKNGTCRDAKISF